MSARPHQRDAVVVGAGPNGLTAAARLARAGWDVVVYEGAATPGGGSRTAPLADGAVYDVCAAVHPFGASSPAFAELGLAAHGLQWRHPPVLLAHPFDDGGAAVMHRSVDATMDGLAADGPRWERTVGWMASRWDRLRHIVLGPVLPALGRHPLTMAWFGVMAGLPASAAATAFGSREAKALLGGLAAHAGTSLRLPTTAGVALALAAAGHAAGMPVAAGGSGRIVDALVAVAREAGAEIVCDRPVTALSDLPPARAVVLDVTPRQLAILADRPAPRWRYGVAAWKLDLLLSGPLPWRSPVCAGAGTVHLGGELVELATAERRTAAGQLPEHPFVLVSQPSAVDPSRAPGGGHVVWAYRHVPNGCTAAAATAGIERQFDRFAPGWRDLVVHARVTTATDYAAYNPSYIGGDIAGGAMTPWQVVARPRLALDPYRTAIDGVWLCSQATPPGPGVHGMCGWHAAGSVLRGAGSSAVP